MSAPRIPVTGPGVRLPNSRSAGARARRYPPRCRPATINKTIRHRGRRVRYPRRAAPAGPRATAAFARDPRLRTPGAEISELGAHAGQCTASPHPRPSRHAGKQASRQAGKRASGRAGASRCGGEQMRRWGGAPTGERVRRREGEQPRHHTRERARLLPSDAVRVRFPIDRDRIAAVDCEERDPEFRAQVQQFYRGQGHRLDHPHMPGVGFVPGT